MLQVWGLVHHAPRYGEMLMCPFSAKGEAILSALQKHGLPSVTLQTARLSERWVILPLPCRELAHPSCVLLMESCTEQGL